VSIDPFHNEFVFYGEGLLAPRPTPKLEDHPLSFIRGCLFNILEFQIVSNNSIITNITSTKFLGTNIDGALSWKNHITNLSVKLNKACYAIRAIKPFVSQESMKMFYYSFAHSLLSYDIIFWGNGPHNENIFKIPKRILRVMTRSGRLDSCRGLFKKLHILPLQSQHIFLYFFLLLKIGIILDLILIFMISICVSIITYICLPQICQLFKEESFSGSRIYNHLPSNIKLKSKNIKEFKLLLKTYLTEEICYSIDEYYK
jgi:hypothetical protein